MRGIDFGARGIDSGEVWLVERETGGGGAGDLEEEETAGSFRRCGLGAGVFSLSLAIQPGWERSARCLLFRSLSLPARHFLLTWIPPSRLSKHYNTCS